MRPDGFDIKRALPRILALILALLLIFACAASAFAKDGKSSDAPAGDTTTTGTSESTGDTTTIGASAPTGESSSGESSSQSDGEISDEERERRKEVYTIAALVAVGAIIVGMRDKRRRR